MSGQLRHHVSNRTLLTMADKAGAETVKAKGLLVTLKLPNGRKLTLQAAHSTRANSIIAIRGLEEGCGGADAFWAHYGPAEEADEAPQAVGAENNPIVHRHDKKKGAPTPGSRPPTRKAEPLQPTSGISPMTPPPRARRRSGASTEVFDVLVALGGTGSIDQIVERTGMKRSTAASAAYYLIQSGIANRVKNGIYQLAKESSPHDQRIQVDLEGGDPVRLSVVKDTTETATAPPAVIDVRDGPPTAASGPSTTPSWTALTPPAPQVTPTLHEETVSTLIDVLFPDGLRISGKNLAALDAWRAATIRLLTEVE